MINIFNDDNYFKMEYYWYSSIEGVFVDLFADNIL